MVLTGYIEKLDLGVDEASGQPNLLVNSAGEYHALPAEDKPRAWVLVNVATELLKLGHVTIYNQIAAGKVESQTVKKNAKDKKGLTFLKIFPALEEQAAARAEDKGRVIRRTTRALQTVWWLGKDVEFFLLLIISNELQVTESEQFGSSEEQRDALIERFSSYADWLAKPALGAIEQKFGPEEAARLIKNHVSKYGNNNKQQEITPGKGTHDEQQDRE